MNSPEERTSESGRESHKLWFLEGYLDRSRSLRRLPVAEFPYRMGRQEELSLCLPSSEISRVHAEIVRKGDSLAIRDMGSTNGTYVNHEPVAEETELQEGDIIHLGTVELRLLAIDSKHVPSDTTRHGVGPLSAELPLGTRQLQDMLLQNQVTAVYQPIVTIQGEIHGWEALGRGAHPTLSKQPMDLFRIAESAGLEIMLSSSFRRVSLALAAGHHPGGLYFLNTHPNETESPSEFVQVMAEVREEYPDMRLVVELHEAAFTDVRVLNQLKRRLSELGIGLAFDDFGAGRSRLVELSDAPPDYIKLDISVIRNLDRASAARREMVEMVLDFARKLAIRVVAEGVSRAGEAKTCREMGFELLQGFHLGRPVPAEDVAQADLTPVVAPVPAAAKKKP